MVQNKFGSATEGDKMKCLDCKGLGFILDNGMYQGKVVVPWVDRMYHACQHCHGSGYLDDEYEFEQKMIKISEEDGSREETTDLDVISENPKQACEN